MESIEISETQDWLHQNQYDLRSVTQKTIFPKSDQSEVPNAGVT
jgi:hypothetical protein